MEVLWRKGESEEAWMRRTLLQSIAETQEKLQMAQREFEMVSEPELVEACVFEIKAHQARYAYFMRLAKTEKTTLGGGHVFRRDLMTAE